MHTNHPNTVEPWEFISPTANGTYKIFGAQIQYFEVFVPENDSVNFVLTNVSVPSRQDGSLRVWVSDEPYGIGKVWGRTDYFSLGKVPVNVELVDHQLKPNTNKAFVYSLSPGRYYINIRNLENSVNNWNLQVVGGEQQPGTDCFN